MAFPTQEFLGFHKHGIAILWSIIVNIAIYFALFSYKKFSFYIHAVLGTMVLTCSLGWVLPLLIPSGIHQGNNQKGVAVSIKTWFGVVFLLFAGILVASGVLGRIFQQNEKIKATWVKYSKKIHYFIGYLTILICKASVLIGYQRTSNLIFWIILSWQIFNLFIFLFVKFYFKTLQKVIIDEQTESIGASVPLISCQSLIKNQLFDYVIFSNYVYSIQKLKTLHPAGYEIVQKVSGRQIDRFLYGMYSAELLPQIAPHSHSSKSLQLIGKPIRKLDIPGVYNNIPQLFDAKIEYLQTTFSNDIFIVYLKPTNQQLKIHFLGYSDISQLGQYYSLTINKHTTRLYTSAHFLQTSNKELLFQMFDNPEITDFNQSSFNQSNVQTKKKKRIDLTGQTLQYGQPIQNKWIPLIIKKYENGKLTSKLCSKQFQGTIQISSPKGLGLHFTSTTPGKIIIVAGGTGIYPFLDLIDLLYKQTLIDKKHPASQTILKYNPILSKNPFNGYSFHLMAAFRQPSDIHPISLFEISQLTQSTNNFKAVFKINDKANLFSEKFPQIKLTKQRFDKELLTLIESQYQKIWICGPPTMNTTIAKLLIQKGVSKNKFLLI